jgi:peptide deformylase
MVEKENQKIWTAEVKAQEKFLRGKAKSFDFDKYSKKDINDLVLFMRTIMIKNYGIGLAAPQIGLNMRVFVAQLPTKDGRGYKGKFYALFNPRLESVSKKTISDAEGCLSVPGYYGTVPRSDKVTITGFDKNNRKVTIKAEGLLARIFQHEIDHLEGGLFTDKSKDVKKIEKNPIND